MSIEAGRPLFKVMLVKFPVVLEYMCIQVPVVLHVAWTGHGSEPSSIRSMQLAFAYCILGHDKITDVGTFSFR